jgi:hypothetical protein
MRVATLLRRRTTAARPGKDPLGFMGGQLPHIQLRDEAQRGAVAVGWPRDVRRKVRRPAKPRDTGNRGVDLPAGHQPDARQGSLTQRVSPQASSVQASTVPGQPGVEVDHQVSLADTGDIYRSAA